MMVGKNRDHNLNIYHILHICKINALHCIVIKLTLTYIRELHSLQPSTHIVLFMQLLHFALRHG